MGIKRKNGEGTAQLRKDGLPKTKNVLAKTKGECVDKLKTLKDTIAPANPSKVRADMPFGECTKPTANHKSGPEPIEPTKGISGYTSNQG